MSVKVPKIAGYKISVEHFTPQNSSQQARRGHAMRTRVVVEKLVRGRGSNFIAAIGESYCSKRDTPSEDTGLQVALGRALKTIGERLN